MKNHKRLLALMLGAAVAGISHAGAAETELLQLRTFDMPPIPTMPPMQLAALSDVPSPAQIRTIVSTAVSEAYAAAPLLPLGKVVKNAPYSTEVISEKIQNLADGNQIGSKTSTMSFRDGMGRTRQEIRDSKGELRQVIINDPVEGTRYTLNPDSKSAIRRGLNLEISRKVEEEKANAEAMKAKSLALKHESLRQEIIVRNIEKTEDIDRDANKNRDSDKDRNKDKDKDRKDAQQEVSVKVIRLGSEDKLAANMPGLNPIGSGLGDMVRSGPIYNAFSDGGASSKTSRKELGSRDFDGVRADGKMSSYSIPAGQVGNKNPITVTSESWYSPELQVTVYSKHSDPRTGDLIYRLANLKRGEPSSALFKVPEGYSIRDASTTINVRVDSNTGKNSGKN
ncbi:hypothetical protein ACO0LO_20835 [Undibacterium sp. TJN25]|uniref:hypothetical protein n=1 Tax=Undibacterium sp. TJN25 TaxID=3413056 RepID=UPI003BF41E29